MGKSCNGTQIGNRLLAFRICQNILPKTPPSGVKTEVIRASTAAASHPDIWRHTVTSFDSFGQFSTGDIVDAIRKAPNKQCVVDPVPVWIIKQSTDILALVITAMANQSFEAGIFPRQSETRNCSTYVEESVA